jgi:prepilin signal peptidase PulO-like enzyme (type II secretory pathway)
MRRGYWFFKGFKFLVLFAIYVVLLAWVVMQLWNMFIPDITGWEQLTYTNALLLMLLVKLLVGFRMHGGGHYGREHYIKNKFREKWSGMSEEEREALREKFKNRWCRKEN